MQYPASFIFSFVQRGLMFLMIQVIGTRQEKWNAYQLIREHAKKCNLSTATTRKRDEKNNPCYRLIVNCYVVIYTKLSDFIAWTQRKNGKFKENYEEV